MYKSRKCQQLQRPNGTKIFLKLQQNYTAAISRDFLVLCYAFQFPKVQEWQCGYTKAMAPWCNVNARVCCLKMPVFFCFFTLCTWVHFKPFVFYWFRSVGRVGRDRLRFWQIRWPYSNQGVEYSHHSTTRPPTPSDFKTSYSPGLVCVYISKRPLKIKAFSNK